MLDRDLTSKEEPHSDADLEWDAFVAAHPHGSILQTTNWSRLKSRFGWQSRRIWVRRDGKLVAGAQIFFRSAALGLVHIGYIPHGPLVDWSDDEQVAVLLNQLDFAAYEHRAGLVKMEPLIWQEEMPQEAWQALCARHGLVAAGDTIQPPRTMVVDLRPDEEEILQNMKQKTRYNVRLASRKGVSVRQGTAADLSTFNGLMEITSERDSFGVHEPAYYRAAYELFAPEQAALFLAEYEDRPLAAIMVFAHGTQAAYLYGASSNEERQRMPAYALQWEAMRWAKARGCTEYDLWGVPDYPEEELEARFTERSDGLWGVYRFKRGFGGELMRTVGAADRVYSRLLYRLYQWRRGPQEGARE
ncbi:MAG: peptidoglycan bridge formation glycyltransferase FemA/FemB family protein [Anaerolineae bacterium]|nr:peptidoglycan bridge formation glycyltransferase FemA/FemB family protein [Anaerolineae bacterium]